jgi:hypothetical protein
LENICLKLSKMTTAFAGGMNGLKITQPFVVDNVNEKLY